MRHKKFKSEELQKAVTDQKAWIAEHGGDATGYDKYYRTRDDQNTKDIYAADMEELRRLEERLMRHTR